MLSCARLPGATASDQNILVAGYASPLLRKGTPESTPVVAPPFRLPRPSKVSVRNSVLHSMPLGAPSGGGEVQTVGSPAAHSREDKNS